MGIFGTLGKIAGSKDVKKAIDGEFAKKKNREQTSVYCNYIKNNMARISSLIEELNFETKTLIAKINASKSVKLSLKEKVEFRKVKKKARKNLAYIYLARDFFNNLAKNASGLILKKEELMLVVKFMPYFEGVPVLDSEDDEGFVFEDYMCRYEEKIKEYIIPDINVAIESFRFATATEEPIEQIACSNCGMILSAKSKFCPECGNKIEIKKSLFCTKCGEPIVEGEKFCSSCGTKLI